MTENNTSFGSIPRKEGKSIYFMEHSYDILQGQFCVLEPIVKNSKVTITLHCIWMIKTKFSLIDIQSFLLIGSSLLKLKESLSFTSQLASDMDMSIPFSIFIIPQLQQQ